ncbi:MAG: hypothetical protein JSR65_09150 [Proteobacteria bacterium]|nr:hypothetical protein [Pseudomonadota bacterium]
MNSTEISTSVVVPTQAVGITRHTFIQWLLGSLLVVSGLFVGPSAFAQGPFPSIQITGLAGTPSGGCTSPSIRVNLWANATSANSDNYTISVNGVVQYTWTGETSGYGPQPAPPGGAASNAYGINGLNGTFAANSTITGTITTYAGVAASGPVTAGQTPTYQSSISWNCTTGAQVGSIVNVDLRAPAVPAPSNSTYSLLAGMICLLALGAFTLRQRRRHIGH